MIGGRFYMITAATDESAKLFKILYWKMLPTLPLRVHLHILSFIFLSPAELCVYESVINPSPHESKSQHLSTTVEVQILDTKCPLPTDQLPDYINYCCHLAQTALSG